MTVSLPHGSAGALELPDAISAVWGRWAAAGGRLAALPRNGGEGSGGGSLQLLPIASLPEFMADAGMDASLAPEGVARAEATAAAGLTQEQTAVLLCSLAVPEASTPSAGGTAQSQQSALQTTRLTPRASVAGAPSPYRKVLSKSKEYMETGYLVYDDTVVSYIRRLEEHRRTCEADGRYREAEAAGSRLVELKTAQVARMRQGLLMAQTQELAEVHRVYEEEGAQFGSGWEEKMKDYEDKLEAAVSGLRSQHESQAALYEQELMLKRPTKGRPTRDYLERIKREESLVKIREYKRAAQLREANGELYQQCLDHSVQAHEVEVQMKMAKLLSKQQVELEALMQRGARGRNNLELKRSSEAERRVYRFRNVVTELESLHRLEVVSLENFLDGQAIAGKARPIKDGFRRKREQLFKSWLL